MSFAKVSRLNYKALQLENEKVRLSKEEIQVIKAVILDLDPNASIYLFGSRADMTLKGGDIDLLILSKTLGPESKLEIRKQLFTTMEEQKIDIIIAKDLNDPFVALVFESGKEL